VNDNLSPTERLLDALDPQGTDDLGLAVVVAQDLPDETATVLADLIHKRLAREISAAYDRGYEERAL
jgi:hypothetical protein